MKLSSRFHGKFQVAKVNKMAFHCIPLAAFTHNSHSALSSKVKNEGPVQSELLVSVT